jgi:lipocalin
MSVNIEGSLPMNRDSTLNYVVLDTDYTNYSLVYSCNPSQQTEAVFLLSRTEYLDRTQYSNLRSMMDMYTNMGFDQIAPTRQDCN